MSFTLAGLAAKFTAVKGSDLVKNISEAVDTFVDTKGEKAERDLKIQEMVQNYNLELVKEATESEKNQLLDVANSRDNNTKIQESDKASWMAKNIAYILDMTFTLAFIIMLIIIIYKQVPEANKELFYTSFGLLGGYVSQIIGFHRGTSIGSKANGDALRKLVAK